MGGEFLVGGTHSADAHVSVQEEDDSRKPLTRRVRGSPLISKDMVGGGVSRASSSHKAPDRDL